jgi:predicted nucleic acid-binding protein
MRLVVDTSVLVGELLRAAGRRRLGNARLELFLPERMWGETRQQLPRRVTAFVRRCQLDPEVGEHLAQACLDAVKANITVLDDGVYSALQDEALVRTLRDPTEWPVVARALALSANVWTNDNDFLGAGVATWTTDTLQAWLDRQPTVDQ